MSATALSDAQLADACRRAGFVGHDLHHAIATAVASSGAIPAYRHTVWPGPAADYRGLWGVDTVEWPQVAALDLANPHEAARAAYELVAHCGDWYWCPAARAGIHHEHYVTAAAAADRLPGAREYEEPLLVNAHLERGRAALVRANAARHAHPSAL